MSTDKTRWGDDLCQQLMVDSQPYANDLSAPSREIPVASISTTYSSNGQQDRGRFRVRNWFVEVLYRRETHFFHAVIKQDSLTSNSKDERMCLIMAIMNSLLSSIFS